MANIENIPKNMVGVLKKTDAFFASDFPKFTVPGEGVTWEFGIMVTSDTIDPDVGEELCLGFYAILKDIPYPSKTQWFVDAMFRCKFAYSKNGVKTSQDTDLVEVCFNSNKTSCIIPSVISRRELGQSKIAIIFELFQRFPHFVKVLYSNEDPKAMIDCLTQEVTDEQAEEKLDGESMERRIRHLYFCNLHADIVFICSGNFKITAHSLVVSVASPVFKELINNSTTVVDGKKEVKINMDPTILCVLLKYIYKSELILPMNFPERQDRRRLPSLSRIIATAEKYQLHGIPKALMSRLTEPYLLAMLSVAHEANCKYLKEACLEMIDEKAGIIMGGKCIPDWDQTLLVQVLKRDTLNANEQDIIEFVCKWSDRQMELRGTPIEGKSPELIGEIRRSILGDIIYQLRFPLLDHSSFTEIHFKYYLVDANDFVEITKAISRNGEIDKFNSSPRKFRSTLIPSIMVCQEPRRSSTGDLVSPALASPVMYSPGPSLTANAHNPQVSMQGQTPMSQSTQHYSQGHAHATHHYDHCYDSDMQVHGQQLGVSSTPVQHPHRPSQTPSTGYLIPMQQQANNGFRQQQTTVMRQQHNTTNVYQLPQMRAGQPNMYQYPPNTPVQAYRQQIQSHQGRPNVTASSGIPMPPPLHSMATSSHSSLGDTSASNTSVSTVVTTDNRYDNAASTRVIVVPESTDMRTYPARNTSALASTCNRRRLLSQTSSVECLTVD